VIIIDDSAPNDVVFAGQTGLDLSTRPSEPYAYSGVASAYRATESLHDIKDLVRERDKNKAKSGLVQLANRFTWPHKNQQSTNFCWANATLYALEMAFLRQNTKPELLSSASVACPITGFDNVGGWGKNALNRLKTHGAVPERLWPNAAINRKYATPAAWEAAKKYRVKDWLEIASRDILSAAIAILSGYCVSAGFNWWRHQVALVDVTLMDGDLAWVIRNSWPNWGENGYAILRGSRMVFDDAVCPVSGNVR
jgi:hypothetical protein